MPANTVQPDGSKVRRIRLEKGWSQEELASRAIISKRTIEHIEASRPTYAGTLAKLAKALGVELKDLLAPDQVPLSDRDGQAPREAPEEPLPLPMVPIEIRIKGKLSAFTEEKQMQLFERIKQILHICGDVRVTSIREGSVVVTLELTREQATRLLQAVKAGELADLGVVDAMEVETEGQIDLPSSGDSVTRWIGDLKAGDPSAAQKLWEHYFQRLVMLARKKLRGTPPGVADEEDVALSALADFFLGAKSGQFTQLRDREDLWRLLVIITTRKAIELVVHKGRRRSTRGDERSAAPAGEIEHVVQPGPSPDIEVMLHEEFERLLASLGDPELQSIAVWKLEGYTNEEIAAKLGCTLRTVERKLRLIRSIWSQEDVPMSESSSSAVSSLAPHEAQQVDGLCDRFEAAWKSSSGVGERPRLEDHLPHDLSKRERAVLLEEQLALELDYRRRLGETPSLEEYRLRFPDQVELIERCLR